MIIYLNHFLKELTFYFVEDFEVLVVFPSSDKSNIENPKRIQCTKQTSRPKRDKSLNRSPNRISIQYGIWPDRKLDYLSIF